MVMHYSNYDLSFMIYMSSNELIIIYNDENLFKTEQIVLSYYPMANTSVFKCHCVEECEHIVLIK